MSWEEANQTSLNEGYKRGDENVKGLEMNYSEILADMASQCLLETLNFI